MAPTDVKESVRMLRDFLKNNNLDAEVLQQCEALGMESISDFAGYFTSADYEAGLQTEVLDHCPSFKSNKIALSRLRICWQRATKEVAKAACSDAGAPVADLEAPLTADDRREQERAFGQAYNIRFEPACMPAEHIYNRAFREFRSGQKGIEDLHRMRSVADVGAVIDKRAKRQLGDITLSWNGDEEWQSAPLNNVLDLLRAHEVMINMWACTGTALRDSKLKPGEKVRDADYSEVLAYHSFAKNKLREHPGIKGRGNTADAISWFVSRDRETRVKARELYNREGYPWGEALRQAREVHMAVLWTVSCSNEAVLPEPSPAKKPRQDKPIEVSPRRVQTSITLQEICSDWNSTKGCTNKQKDCPHGKKHVCSYKETDGQPCGKWQHNKQRHLSFVHNQGF